MWRREDSKSWKLDSEGLEGEAKIVQVEGGYRAELTVKDTEYGMELEKERAFFQSETDAEEFLKDKMEELD